VTAGRAITRLRTPRGVEDARSYRNEMKLFTAALAKFDKDAEAGTDEQLKTSYLAVHDTFENLAALLPRKPKH
jgi:hypothetical protein